MAGSLQKSETPANSEGNGTDDISGGIGLGKSGGFWSDNEPENYEE